MTATGRELTVAELDQLHTARGYVCACPPDVALADCPPCTAAADRLNRAVAARFDARLAELRAEAAAIDRREQLAAGGWTPAGGGLEVRLS